MGEIRNDQDVIDSRDVIERLEELEAIALPVYNVETQTDEFDPSIDKDEREEARRELFALRELIDQAEGYAEDWSYGVVLIRDSYFEEYAQEWASDIGAYGHPLYMEPGTRPQDMSTRWPFTCIDWEQAARELQDDYTAVNFDGVTYWVR
jgi:hypothetical protein